MRRFTQISFILVFWLVISTCLLSSPVYGFVSSVVETKSTAYLQHTSEEGVLAVMASDLKLASIKATASKSFVGSCDYDPARWDSLLYDASFQYANEALKNSPHILHPSITARGPPQNFKYDEWVQYDEGVLLFAPSTGGKPFWGSWNDYKKVSHQGRDYAQVGDRLYTRHAVDRMQPRGLGAPAGADGAGRSIAPTFVEDVIQNGSTTRQMVDGVERTIHTSGSVQVVTEQGGKVVITINPFSGGN